MIASPVFPPLPPNSVFAAFAVRGLHDFFVELDDIEPESRQEACTEKPHVEVSLESLCESIAVRYRAACSFFRCLEALKMGDEDHIAVGLDIIGEGELGGLGIQLHQLVVLRGELTVKLGGFRLGDTQNERRLLCGPRSLAQL